MKTLLAVGLVIIAMSTLLLIVVGSMDLPEDDY